MANNLSQEKRNRQNVKRRTHNRSIRSELRTRERAVVSAAESGDASATAEALRLAQKRIDMAAAKGVLHPNAAARRKSRLTRRAAELLG